MNYLAPQLKDDYEFIVREFCPEDNHADGRISEMDVLKAHYVLSDFFIKRGDAVRFGVLNYHMLSSAVGRQDVEFDGHKKWTDQYHRMATLVYGLTKDHAFQDGNKRTALLALLLHLNQFKRELVVDKSYLEQLIVNIAAGNLAYYKKEYKQYKDFDDPEIEIIAHKLRNWTRARDTRLYTITYSDLNTNLHRFGVSLEDPKGNAIGVYMEKDSKSFFVSKKKKVRVCQIGFPGWKKQICDKDLKDLLKATGLTPDNWVDSAVLFKGETPIYELIKEYRGPLERLKDQ